MQRTRTVTPPTFFTELWPYEIFPSKNCVCFMTLIPSRICSWNCVKIQTTIRWCAEKNGIMPLWNFSYENHVCSITLIPLEYFHEILYKYKPSSDDVQRTRTITPSTFLWNYAPSKFFLWELCLLYNFNTHENIFMKLCTNKYKAS